MERVVIVGLSTRAFAESAVRAGYSCVSVDAFGDLDQKARLENISLLRDRSRPFTPGAAATIAAGLPASAAAYVANLENHPAAVKRLARGRELLGNSPEALKRARDHDEISKVVSTSCRMPLTFRTPIPKLPSGKSWLRKPERGGGGSGVRAYVAGSPLGPDELLQEKINGTLGSAAFIADGRRALVIGVSEGLAGDPAFGAIGYRYCGNLFPLALEPRLLDRLYETAQTLTQALGLRGVNGVDFVRRDGELFLLELNPRYSASMELMERAGCSIFEAHVAACRGSLSASPPIPMGVFGKAILWAQHDLTVRDTRPFLLRENMRDIPFPGDRIQKGHPICTVFAQGKDRADCYSGLVVVASALGAELEEESQG